jgi:excinuclease ABC subunit C
MSEVVRRRDSRILLEGRKKAGEDADFSQESPLEAMRRLESADEKAPGRAVASFVRLPDLVIVDGGKGQLSSATEELQRLGLHELPIVGLAKEEEEIYRPGRADPIRIPHDRGALKLLQRIRDEAHRWANGYHQLLLKRRVAESLLDDCPGVSETRKANLLREFGSVARLRRASLDDIAGVTGIGRNLAENIKKFLDERK